ncbi:MAG: SO_0444 family Cu/Zn efflux transporter [Planctomycetota bacterium]
MATLIEISWRAWAVLAEMAPYLLLGFAVAGLLKVVLPTAWIQRQLGGRGLGSTVKSALMGVPLPLCSCGVMPVAASLRGRGASRGATASFLIATPQTGVDSLLATAALLGWPMAVARAVAALVIGVVSGVAAEVWPRGGASGDRAEPAGGGVDASSCYGGAEEAKTVSLSVGSSCCSSEPAESVVSSCCGSGSGEHEKVSWGQGVRFAFVTLPRDIALLLLLGVVVAGFLTAVLTPEAVGPYLGGWWAVPLMAVAGMPVYICSTGVIPLAMGLVGLGASPGAALTLMIAGPAANAATWSIAHKTMGAGAAAATLGAATLGAIVVGYAVDWTGGGGWLLAGVGEVHAHAAAVSWVGHVGAVVLIVMLSQRWWPTMRSMARAGRDKHGEPGAAASTSA